MVVVVAVLVFLEWFVRVVAVVTVVAVVVVWVAMWLSVVSVFYDDFAFKCTWVGVVLCALHLFSYGCWVGVCTCMCVCMCVSV